MENIRLHGPRSKSSDLDFVLYGDVPVKRNCGRNVHYRPVQANLPKVRLPGNNAYSATLVG